MMPGGDPFLWGCAIFVVGGLLLFYHAGKDKTRRRR